MNLMIEPSAFVHHARHHPAIALAQGEDKVAVRPPRGAHRPDHPEGGEIDSDRIQPRLFGDIEKTLDVVPASGDDRDVDGLGDR